MDIGFILSIILFVIFGCIFIFCLNLLFKKMVGVEEKFKFKINPKVIFEYSVIFLVIIISEIAINILKIKYFGILLLISFIIVKSIYDIIVYKKLTTEIKEWIFYGFVFLWMFFVPKILIYFKIFNSVIFIIITFVMPLVILYFVAFKF